MTEHDILDLLARTETSAERLLDECRGPDQKLWQGNAKLYRAFTQKLLTQGFPARALDLAREGQEYLRDDLELHFLLALAARRGGNPRYAQAILEPLLPQALDPGTSIPAKLRVDLVALNGSILKILSRTNPVLVTESAEWYTRAAELPDADTYPLINAATMWRLAGDEERSRTLAEEVIRRNAPEGDPLWSPATLAEAHLLCGNHEEATQLYQQAVTVALSQNRLGELASLRTNIELLRQAGVTADPAFLDEHLGSVVTFSGHMIDSPERVRAGHPTRFPNDPRLIAAVGRAIAEQLDRMNAKIGFSSLACGGDLLFAQAMLARKGELHIVLPFAQHDFLRTSVNFGQPGEAWRKWRAMFDEVLDAIPPNRVRYTTVEPYLGSNELFGLSGRVQQGLAVMRARERGTVPQALLLVDYSSAGQAGGTQSFAKVWHNAGYQAHEIHLNAIRESVGELVISMNEKPAAPIPTSKLKRPVKSVLFADVAGFSRIPEWMLSDFLEDYSRFLKGTMTTDVGQRLTYANTWGDGIYAVFDSVTDAAAFALELLEPLTVAEPDWAHYELAAPSPFRIGLHTGPVFELPDLFQGRSAFGGQHVTRAARIEPATIPGCAYASEPFAALLMREASALFHIESVGLHSLAKEYDRCPLYRIARAVSVGR